MHAMINTEQYPDVIPPVKNIRSIHRFPGLLGEMISCNLSGREQYYPYLLSHSLIIH